MRVMLATIALNEMQWLPKLIEQHKDWPGLVGWCIVEGADPVFVKTNPGVTTVMGLSTDGTTDFLLSISGGKFIYVPQGICTGGVVLDQHKCILRNEYLKVADYLKPDAVIVLDADEFYTHKDQQRINTVVQTTDQLYEYRSWMFRQRHIWYPPAYQGLPVNGSPYNIFSQEVVGGYWQVPHTRVWKYLPNMRHVRNHNWPEKNGVYLTNSIFRADLVEGTPECIHMGYASNAAQRQSKHHYYVARGEGREGGRIGRKRRIYLDCRKAWEEYLPQKELPHGAKVVPYTGPIPEVFQ